MINFELLNVPGLYQYKKKSKIIAKILKNVPKLLFEF